MLASTQPAKAAWYGLIAVVLVGLAWWRNDWALGWRIILVASGLVLGVVWLAWVAEVLLYLIGNARAAWLAPYTRQLELISRMSPAQLAAVGQAMITLTHYPVRGGFEKRYTAATMKVDLDAATVRRLTNYCLSWPRFPQLPVQHGKGESHERDQLQAYTVMVVTMGLAAPARGAKAAEWVVSVEEILGALEIRRKRR